MDSSADNYNGLAERQPYGACEYNGDSFSICNKWGPAHLIADHGTLVDGSAKGEPLARATATSKICSRILCPG